MDWFQESEMKAEHDTLAKRFASRESREAGGSKPGSCTAVAKDAFL